MDTESLQVPGFPLGKEGKSPFTQLPAGSAGAASQHSSRKAPAAPGSKNTPTFPTWGDLRPNKTLNISQQGLHVPGTSRSREQHTNLKVFPTEAGDGGFMKASSFHFLCKLVLILAKSTHCYY